MLQHSRNAEAEIVHIVTNMARRKSSRVRQLTVESDQINQTITCPQLHKTKLLNFPFPDAAKHVAIKRALLPSEFTLSTM